VGKLSRLGGFHFDAPDEIFFRFEIADVGDLLTRPKKKAKS
jgi:hypothetical protein